MKSDVSARVRDHYGHPDIARGSLPLQPRRTRQRAAAQEGPTVRGRRQSDGGSARRTSGRSIGLSRSLPWKRRPEALRLLDTIKSAGRDFDAVVIGEPQRAFYGSQFGMTFPVFVHYGLGL